MSQQIGVTLRAEVSLFHGFNNVYEVVRVACLSRSWFVYATWETSAAKPRERLRKR